MQDDQVYDRGISKWKNGCEELNEYRPASLWRNLDPSYHEKENFEQLFEYAKFSFMTLQATGSYSFELLLVDKVEQKAFLETLETSN